MTGAQHYQDAERLARAAAPYVEGDRLGYYDPAGQALLALAQVHATLAVAAATALDAALEHDPQGNTAQIGAWREAGAW